VDSDSNKPIAFLWIDVSNNSRDDIADFVPPIVADGWIVFDDAASQSFVPGCHLSHLRADARPNRNREGRDDPELRRVPLRYLATHRRSTTNST